MKILVICLLLPLAVFTQQLTNSTAISITKTWPQEPSGWTYPMIVNVPNTPAPSNGYPVCILLHGNGGQGQSMLMEFQNKLDCHALIAPTGYQNSWNISDEASDAPDVEMVTDLVNQLQSFTNVDASKIRIIGFSNGSALANRVLIENSNTGIDLICSMVTQLTEASYHNGSFYYPLGPTNSNLPFNGYNAQTTPISGRKYLNICNTNDPVIPYYGGNFQGLTFLDAQLAAFVVAQSQGYTGTQLSSGNIIGSGPDELEEFSYLSDQVVHLKGAAGHGSNVTQLDYISSYFSVDCSPTNVSFNPTASVDLFPNPAKDFITISIENFSSNFDVKIYDLNGKLLLQSSNQLSIDLTKLSPGFYTVNVTSSVFDKEFKLIKH